MILRLLLSSLFILMTINTSLETLQYKWSVDDVHRFQTKSVDDITISGMGVNLNIQLH